MKTRLTVLLFALAVAPTFAQEVYHCDFERRLAAAAKQGVSTVTSADGKFAYSVTGERILRWSIRPVIEWQGATNMSASANGVMAQAFQDWEDQTGVNFEGNGNSTNAVWPNQDGVSQVLIADPADLGGAAALTQRFGAPGTVEADIGFDPNIANGSNDAFILSIARHEIGHLLGLQHVADQSSLMFATILSGSTKPIDSGSKEGIAFLYAEKEDLDNVRRAYESSVASGARDRDRNDEIGVISQSATSPDDLLIVTGDRSGSRFGFRSTDRGASFVEADVVARRPQTIAHFEGDRNIVYAAADDGIYRSDDAGLTWVFKGRGGFAQVGDLSVSPTNPDVLYGDFGAAIYRSTNGGESWSFLSASPFVTTVFDVLALDDQAVWMGSEKGAHRTIDGGSTFTEMNTGFPDDTTVYSLARDPNASSTLYAGTSSGVYRTTNSGASWSRITLGLGAARVTTIEVVGDGTVYALSDIGLYRLASDEGSWVPLDDTIGTYGLTGLVVTPGNADQIFVSSLFGLFSSQNGGTTFTQVALPEVNSAPTLQTRVLDRMTFSVDDPSFTIDVDSIATFTDPNGDPLTYSLASSHLFTASIDGKTLTLTPIASGQGGIHSCGQRWTRRHTATNDHDCGHRIHRWIGG